jgi:hypothetical protein
MEQRPYNMEGMARKLANSDIFEVLGCAKPKCKHCGEESAFGTICYSCHLTHIDFGAQRLIDASVRPENATASSVEENRR